MATQEIDHGDWGEFCNRFTALHKGAAITIEQVHKDGTSHALAQELRLNRMKFEKTNGCSDRLLVEFGEGAGAANQHVIVEPIHIRIPEHAEGAKTVQIDAESGTTMLRFSSGKLKELLDGLRVLEGKNIEPVEFGAEKR